MAKILIKASPAVSKHITRLAFVRKKIAKLTAEARPHINAIIRSGSCQNAKYKAYVSHTAERRVEYFHKAATSVRLERK